MQTRKAGITFPRFYSAIVNVRGEKKLIPAPCSARILLGHATISTIDKAFSRRCGPH
jgi:hypothetical protein